MLDFSLPTDFGGADEELDFRLSDVSRGGADDGLETGRYVRPRVYDNVLSAVEYEHAINFVRGLDLSEGHREFAFVSGNFVFGDVLEAMVETRRVEPRSMTVQTLSMSEENIDSLRNVIEMCPALERCDWCSASTSGGTRDAPGSWCPTSTSSSTWTASTSTAPSRRSTPRS